MTAAAALQRAQAALERGDLARAGSECERALAAAPEHPDALHLLGVIAHQRGEPQRAAQFIARACAQAPQHALFARNLGLALAAAGDEAAAEAQFLRAIAIEPAEPHGRLQLASLYHRRGDATRALRHYRAALAQLPDLAELHNQIGVCLLQLDDPADAVRALEHCLALEPAHADARENLARAWLRLRRFDAAHECIESLLEKTPQRDEAWRLLGFCRLHRGDLEGASQAFLTPMRRHFAPGAAGGESPADPDTVTHTKLVHDIQQLEYLAARGLLQAPRADALLLRYRAALARIPAGSRSRFFHETPRVDGFAALYNRLHLDWEAPRHEGGALDKTLDHAALTTAFRRDGWAVADGLLTRGALRDLYRFCSEPTIWFEKKFRHEVGASLRNGFCCPLLLQIAEELRTAFPEIFGRHLFSGCFSYKYFPGADGGHLHADRGAVSMNMWITPDRANLEPGRGGLVLWNRRVPPEYFREQPEEIDTISERLIGEPGAKASVVPYRCNRALLFPSDVLHRTDSARFADGYENRRISVTFLFGRPGD